MIRLLARTEIVNFAIGTSQNIGATETATCEVYHVTSLDRFLSRIANVVRLRSVPAPLYIKHDRLLAALRCVV